MSKKREGEPGQISNTGEAVEQLINGNVDGVMQTYESYGERAERRGLSNFQF
jgi:hypothetical protein